MHRRRFLMGFIAVFVTMFVVVAPGEQPTPLRFDGTFINPYKALPGGDYETTYARMTTQQQMYYGAHTTIALTPTLSYEVKSPLASEIPGAKPYYGTWLYGGAAKANLIFSVIQVHESEVPASLLDSSRRYGGDPRASILLFKIVIDSNTNNNFNDDEAYYTFVYSMNYSSNVQMTFSVPVEYVTEGSVAPVETRSYNMDLQFQQPARDFTPSSIGIRGNETFEAVVSFGDQRLKTWLIDQNLNGVWDSADLWVIDLDRDGQWDIQSRFSVEKFGFDEPVNVGDKSYQLAIVNPATKTLKVTLAERRAEPREVIGVGAKAPAFIRTDLLSRRAISSLDLSGKPYVVYYLRGSNREQIPGQLEAVVTLLDKHLGLDNISLIIVLDNIEFESLINLFPPGRLPYHLFAGQSREYDSSGRSKHFLHGFKIDPDQLQNRNVLIAVDGAGTIRYLSKDASSEQIVEVCQLLQPLVPQVKEKQGLKKKEKRATLWNLFGLFGARKPKAEATPTPAVTPPPEPTATALIHVPRVPTTAAPVAALPALVAPAPAPAPIQESDVRKALDWFSAHRDLVDKALAPGRIFYQGRDTQTYGVHSKTFGQNDAIRLPDNDVNSWTPRLSLDRRTLYLKMSDRTDNSTHFVALTAGEEPKDLIRIAGSVGYYDVSPDKTEIAFTTKQENLNHVYRLRFEGGEPIRFSDETVGGVFPAYAPDGKTIAYCASKKLRLKDIATGEEKIVVGDDLAKELPAWSPDGKWITYQASAGDEFSYDIYKVNVETGEVVRLTKEPGIDANPCFSADGAKIAFMSERETGNGNQTLYVMDADGSNVTRDPTSKPGIYFPRW